MQDKTDLKVNLEQQARQCDWLVLWLDCDREGENIAFEVCMPAAISSLSALQMQLMQQMQPIPSSN